MTDEPMEPPEDVAPEVPPLIEAANEADRKGLRWIGIVAAAVILVVVLSQRGSNDDKTTPAEDARRAAELEEFLSTNVLYEVEGSTDWASITFETPTGTQQANPDVPLKMASGPRSGERGLLVGPFQPGDFVYISAQNKREYGTVTCRISTEDGRVISENTSSGGFAIATCDGSL